jgi:hypothetical protein
LERKFGNRALSEIIEKNAQIAHRAEALHRGGLRRVRCVAPGLCRSRAG